MNRQKCGRHRSSINESLPLPTSHGQTRNQQALHDQIHNSTFYSRNSA